jgi:hypothetical protein
MASEIGKAKIISVRELPNGSERLIQDLIADDPSILNLNVGSLVLRDRERTQPSGGRLDILLEDADSGENWYEVEIQLGATNETHIIRTIEYWDREQRRYPDVRHTAVIVAEEINGRFFNVIGLFNRQMPIIAVKVVAFMLEGQFGVLFTKILDYEPRATRTEDDGQTTTREDWEKRSSPETLQIVDEVLGIAKTFDPTIRPEYHKSYIGLVSDTAARNFLAFHPKSKHVRLSLFCLQPSEDFENAFDKEGLPLSSYNKRWRKYSVQIGKKALDQHGEFLRGEIKKSLEQARRYRLDEGDVATDDIGVSV